MVGLMVVASFAIGVGFVGYWLWIVGVGRVHGLLHQPKNFVTYFGWTWEWVSQ